jgi:phosphatidylinositol kinase/protein kinase (PI-3  family)
MLHCLKNSSPFFVQSILENYLNLYFRDELVEWVRHEILREKEPYVHQLAQHNCELTMKKLQNVAPPLQPSHPLTLVPVNSKITQLIEAAQSKSNLARMDPTWFPWL